MFGMFKKKITTQDLLLISIKAAVLCKKSEDDNAGLMTDPTVIKMVIQAVSKGDSKSLSEAESNLVTTWVMSFLLEGDFVERLLARTRNGPIGTFTEQDERDIQRILPTAFR